MLVQNSQIVPAFVPVDMSSAANNGDWVSMKDYNRCAVVLLTSVGTAGDDPIFKLQQATANDGTGAKDLTFDSIYEKEGATALSAVGQYSLVEQSAATSYTNADAAENETLMVVEIQASDLDAANDFDHVQLSVADVGTNAQLGVGFYILYEPRHAAQITPSAL